MAKDRCEDLCLEDIDDEAADAASASVAEALSIPPLVHHLTDDELREWWDRLVETEVLHTSKIWIERAFQRLTCDAGPMGCRQLQEDKRAMLARLKD